MNSTGESAQAAQDDVLVERDNLKSRTASSRTGSFAFAEPVRPRAAAPRSNSATPASKPTAAPAVNAEANNGSEPAKSDRQPVVKFPDLSSGSPDEIWGDFFARNQPRPVDVWRQVSKLHAEGRHEHVIAAVEAALINGQSQPWMYEVLALSMKIEKYPQEDVERVMLSMTDFGGADFNSMITSAAYLVRLDSLATALRLYRQAARISPERHEPYVLAFRHAMKLNSEEDIVWSACGILKYDWSKDHVQSHRDAGDALAALEKTLTKKNDADRLARLRAAIDDARQRDVVIELTWSGTGDLDLEVEEPYGSVCSFAQPQTGSGGFLLNDGFGPRPEDCRETYVCPQGPSGEYRVRVKHSWGQVVGQRATLTLTTHQGTPNEKKEQRTVVLEKGLGATSVDLADGRRTQMRPVAAAPRPLDRRVAGRPMPRRRFDADLNRAAMEFAQSRGAVVGFVGFEPIIQTLTEGATLGASAVVSPDRRYVRLGLSPVFSNITDVFTFSVFGGVGNQNAGGQAGGQPGANR